jgi:SAM-dependent methyltransferase
MVNPEISPDDRMCEGSTEHYFAVGRSALHCIKVSMLAAGNDTFANILDLPSGHGRVLRHLRSAFPEAQLTACDLDRSGVDFCAATFGAIPVYGHQSPYEIQLRSDYDLIWVGSLLTHLDSARCLAFLEVFRASLGTKGLLVFTVHGRGAADLMRKRVSSYGLNESQISELLTQHSTEGFGYTDYPTAVPNIGKNYGISLASPCWVYKVMEKMPDMQLVNYTEAGWDNHQDVVTLRRV